MRILRLEYSGRVYTSQVYLVLGDTNQLEDVNTLFDVGAAPALLASLEKAPTGAGKWPVEQVVLTHSHSYPCALLPQVRAAFLPRALAFSPHLDGIDRRLHDRESICMGDAQFEVVHAPGHSSGSICLYNEAKGVHFAGATPLLMISLGSSFEARFRAALQRLCACEVSRIYFGHGPPLTECCNQRLRASERLAAHHA
ncbi:MAG: hypothetical protein ACLGP3_05075 [Acidobacteriota bacterium]